ncbi:zonular occludens toxin domain-containing protein [Pseudoxanthomonas winnipegensis]|uniref:zonular occludens toxin domain-containing protein n=1 Tax=Pseudoxanthomonas winnipegensis TaxID=2480810 RepID=UPI0025762C09|nr:zonular occludens toxin domain-containing protein [Pseudoxanthomonas winnipegensis]WJI17472.1 zonular occludens toxin domain-containing protein [Pseudoxanthomonas winnipegensis]
MPIEIYTGKPGNGKTALMMERLVAEAKKAERPIFASGIDGLQPGLATVLDDPKRWNEKDADGNYVLPNGALWFVDEAWKWFGHLTDASRQVAPPHVMALAEHRHRGIDMVWTTQGPNQLYPFARPLIADHYHTVRRFGTSVIDVFHWEEMQEEVKSTAKREVAQRTTRTLPTSTFGTYKSAEVHTIKRRIPLKVMMLPLLLVVAIVCAWFAYSRLKPSAYAASLGAGRESAAASAAAGSGSAAEVASKNERPQPKWKSLSEYAADHLPRFASMPWTAPVYDSREVTADPMVYCMATGAGLDANGRHTEPGCGCRTEQGTVYEMTEPECRRVANNGMPYNPYRRTDDRRSGESVTSNPTPRQGQGSGSVVKGAQMASYGDIGVAPPQKTYSSM